MPPRLLMTILAVCATTFAQAPDFTRKVAPVLERTCIRCHGPAKTKGKLSLATREAMLRGGRSGPALVPGDAAASLLFGRAHAGDDDTPRMPPDGPYLSPDDLAGLRSWIEAGAPWPDGVTLRPDTSSVLTDIRWWSLAPIRTPEIPDRGEAHPIDAFVRRTLAARGLSPNPRADRRTLIRRATYDLHGLPPTPEEVAAFLADDRPDAWAHLVDRLLASPRYGERQAQRWLDLVHYGDSHGYDKDKPRRHAWPYRDWVIRAFDTDRPWKRFVEEQLAGDILWPDSPDGIVATGFIAAGPWDFVGHVELREGTAAKDDVRNLDRDDMVMTTMSTFASTTVHCARCHDHEFDPIPQEDYYALQAVFAGVERAPRPYVRDPAETRRRRELGQQRQDLTRRSAEIQERIGRLDDPMLERHDARLKDLDERLAAIPKEKSTTLGWHSAILDEPDATPWAQVDLGETRAIDRIVLVPAHVKFGGHPGPGFGFPLRFRVEVSDDADFQKARTVADHTRADFPHPGDDWVALDEGTGELRARHVRVTATRLFERTKDWIFALGELLVLHDGVNIARDRPVTSRDSVEAHGWGRRHLVDGSGSRFAVDHGRLASWTLMRRDAARERAAHLETILPAALRSARDGTARDLDAVRREIAALPPVPHVYAAATDFKPEGAFRPPKAPRPIHVLARGELRAKGALAGPGALSALPALGARFTDCTTEGERRVALARWLTHRDNPLSWRSAVNRLWQSHFGAGIVPTPNDFGRMGRPPSHPRLLDWLAARFRDGGGSMKAMHRLIMTSETYRQTSTSRADAAAVDAQNRLLWRQNRRRLEAEAVRDAMLATSGRLDLTTGGPPEELFVFKDDHSPVYDFARYEDGPERRHRRSIYRFIVRSTPDPFLECLDCADPSLLVPKRQTTLTAPQALAMLNNRLTLTSARALADRLDATIDRAGARIDRAVRLLFARGATPEELTALSAHAARHGLARTIRVLFNTNEFVFID